MNIDRQKGNRQTTVSEQHEPWLSGNKEGVRLGGLPTKDEAQLIVNIPWSEVADILAFASRISVPKFHGTPTLNLDDEDRAALARIVAKLKS